MPFFTKRLIFIIVIKKATFRSKLEVTFICHVSVLIELINQAFYHVGVLGVKVKGLVECSKRKVLFADDFVDFANHDLDRGLFGDERLEVFQHLKAVFVALQG